MKRSELKGRLAAVMINHNDLESCIRRDKALDIAEQILIEIEKHMLPPRIKLGTLQVEDNAWEPEEK